MKHMPRSVPSPSKVRILLAAERLFGRHGIEGVSLRQIAEAAGHGNVNATQYHFGNKDGLVLAIMHYRRPNIDAHRAQLASNWGVSLDSAPISILVRLIHMGLFDQVDEDGRRSYALFLRSVLQFDTFNHIWRRSGDSAPFTDGIYRSLRNRLPRLSDRLWEARFQALGRFGVNSIVDFDAGLCDIMSEDEFLADLERMVVAALACAVTVE